MAELSGGLFDEHRRELTASSISPDIITARGYTSIGRPTTANQDPRHQLKTLGIPTWATKEDRYFPGLLIPLYRATGERVSFIWKPRVPIPNDGKPMKYAAAKGRPSVVDVHPINRDKIVLPTVDLWVTEGVKKADSLTSRGLCTIALSGVYNWRSHHGTLGDWEDIPLRGRHVTICFDADARTNPNVLRAMVRFGKWLKSKGAKPHYLITPDTINNTPTKGVDDYFHAGGTLEHLTTLTTTTAPHTESVGDTYTDSRLAETIADELFDGAYCWASGFGWLHWNGTRWAICTDVTVAESVRQYSLTRFAAAAVAATKNGGDAAAIDGWRTMLSAGRQRSVTSMTRGVVERAPEHFDAHPDLLNTPTGVVDLETDAVLPHDPDLLMQKISGAGYRPDATHPDWTEALKALPDDVRDYMQIRLGQAITGHMPPDDILVVMHGGGSNGKTTISETLSRAIGDYYLLVSDRALMGNPGDHPTELMDFMGRRYCVLEETPEARRLDPQRLKRTIGTPRITARRIRENSITFDATHSLFLSTNHRPVVDDTDYGTWRRLQLVSFPYRYRKPWENLEKVTDRRGDMGLRERCKTNPEVWAAALAWLVEGARKWYANDKVMPEPPASVQRDTRLWRGESDLVMKYIDEHLIKDPDGAHILAADLHTDFNAWLHGKGHSKWSDRVFSSRFGEHDELGSGVTKKRMRAQSGLSRPAPRNDDRDYRLSSAATSSTYVAWVGIRFRTQSDLGHHDFADMPLTSENSKPVTAVTARSDWQLEAPCGPLTELAVTAVTHSEHTSTVTDEITSFSAQQFLPGSEENPGGNCPACRWPLTSRGHHKNCLNEE